MAASKKSAAKSSSKKKTTTTKKAATKKASTKKAATKKAATKKATPKKAATKKPAVKKKAATKKAAAIKPSTKKAATKKVATKKKAAVKKVVAPKAETKKASVKKATENEKAKAPSGKTARQKNALPEDSNVIELQAVREEIKAEQKEQAAKPPKKIIIPEQPTVNSMSSIIDEMLPPETGSAPIQPSISTTIGIIGIDPYVIVEGEEYMGTAQRAHFKNILTLWKQSLMEEVDRIVTHMQDEAANFPDPNDRATQEEEFGMALRARARERTLIKKIDESLERLKTDEYGFCETCGIEIGIRRLEARPTANLCIDCKTLEEIRERQNR